MGSILVYSEKDELAWELLGKAAELKETMSGPVCVALLGPDAAQRAAAAFDHGAEAAYTWPDVPAALPADSVAEALCLIVEQTGDDTLVLLASTIRGKGLAPRLAQKLDAGCITDALSLSVDDGHVMARRYAFGGNTVASEIITTPVQVVAVQPKTFEARPGRGAGGDVVQVVMSLPPSRLETMERRPKGMSGAHIEDAERLLCVGRGLAHKEDLAMIEELARLLQAEIGCTRTLAFDYHWLGEDRLVGLSGKRAKPRLYLGIGVSGQIQHTVGVSGARIIAAINQDKDAPIMQMADYAVVGDLYQVVPRLIERLKS